MGNIILSAMFIVCMTFVLLFLIANALPKSKHDEWHDHDGK